MGVTRCAGAGVRDMCPVLLAGWLVVLAACAPVQMAPSSEDTRLREIDAMIAASVERASKASWAVAAAEAALIVPERAGPGQTIPPGVELPEELHQKVWLDWHGPVESLLAALAKRIQYSFSVVGERPATPTMVTFRHQRIELYEVVRRAGIAIHARGDVALSPADRRIELRYGP